MYTFVFFPFEGFYNSRHDDEIDHTFESLWLEDMDSEQGEKLFREIDWGMVHRLYSIEYVNWLQQFLAEDRDCFLPTLTFFQLESPREYNFTTDKIIAALDYMDWRYLCGLFDEQRMSTLLDAFFTPCDGFIPFYSRDIDQWMTPAERSDTDLLLQWILHKANAVERGVFFLACFDEDITDEQIVETAGTDSIHERIISMLEQALSEEGERILNDEDDGED